jgi:signal transduction histidine kinase
VRISLTIALVAVIITLFPLAARRLGLRPGGFSPVAITTTSESGQTLLLEEASKLQATTVDRVWWLTWSTVAFGAVVGLGVGVLLSRSLIKPLVALEQGAKAVAAHELTHRVPEKGSREMKTVAHAFNEMAAELKRAQLAQRNMLADITHELRHPVHLFQGNLQGIIDGVFPLEMEEILLLSEETRRLSQLVNDLHELAMAEAHELPLHKQEIEICGMIRNAVDAVRPLALEKEIVLHTYLPSSPVFLVADERHIRQAILNLLSNAIRYTSEGGKVSVALAETPVDIEIAVTDMGMGIASDDLPYVFDRFYRTDASRNRETSGTGLGLAITKAIVEGHNGRILADSPGIDQGSTFTVYLPVDNRTQRDS